MDRPIFVNDEHLEFLDVLRETGVTNMFGAAPYLVREFEIPEKEANKTLVYWMKTFSERHPK